jgi:hypothetical protein
MSAAKGGHVNTQDGGRWSKSLAWQAGDGNAAGEGGESLRDLREEENNCVA